MSTITSLTGSTPVTTAGAATVINTNFSNLNTDKIETSYLDTDTAMAANSDVKIPSQKAVKTYIDTQGGANASETVRGIVEEATDAEVTAGTATGATGAKLFVTPAKLATQAFAKTANIVYPFPVQDLIIKSGAEVTGIAKTTITSTTTGTVIYFCDESGATITIYRALKDTVTGNYYITHSTTLATSGAGGGVGIAATSANLFVSWNNGGTPAMTRYSLADLSGAQAMTFSGTGYNATMFSDGTFVYIYRTTDIFVKFTISGTTATNGGDVTYTTAGVAKGAVSDGTSVWISDDTTLRKYPIAGGAATGSNTMIGSVAETAYKNAQPPGLFIAATGQLGIGFIYNNSDISAIIGKLLHLFAITQP